ncbi:MAG TPA: PQQ-dependent sugar dehydrogenase [Polyangiaceae bacterium]|nr:PQQ-dependent sugar dehydrogenase [Polyangiaceae bacterium]
MKPIKLWFACLLHVLVCLTAIGCSSIGPEEFDEDPDGTYEGDAIGQVLQPATINDPGFSDAAFASGFSNPTAMAFAPDGRLFVCQQTGQLRVIKNGALLATPFLTVAVDSAGERGLLGVTFDPNFASNQFVYIYYTTTSGGTHNRISRFTASGDVALAGSELQLVNLPALSGATNHNGGAMHFGNDGKLYVAVGENATGSNSQSMSTPLGKMLRFNADGSIPSDNPFFASTSGLNRAIWALGLRNPFTFAVQRTTGTIFINDVGGGSWEEVNRGQPGANYGWPTTEGATSNPSFVSPVFSYPHAGGTSGGCAITGGTFYNPVVTQFPGAYVGQYFFMDYCNNWMRRMNADGSNVSVFATGLSSAVDLTTGPDGALYYLQRGGGGGVRRISFGTGQAPTISAQPANATVPVGGSATFTVSAAGSAPLAYQWQRNGVNIGGATAPSFTFNNAQPTDNGAQFRAVVSNSFGTATSNAAVLTVSTNNPPMANITNPGVGATYTAGGTINFAGTGTDPEQGNLPPSAFTWRIDFHHDTHSHPAMPDTVGIANGSFQVPNTGETSANVWYRVYLTVRDAQGFSHTTFRDVNPLVSSFTLATNPTGLQVTLDGQPFTTPFTTNSVVGLQRVLGAPSPQAANGKNWAFTSWSNGGAQTHTITTAGSTTTYTASFTETASQQLTISSSVAAGAFQTAPGLSHDNNETTRYTNDGTLPTASITYTLSASSAVSRVRLLMYSSASRTYPLRISVGSSVVFTGVTTLGSGYFEANFPAVTGSAVTVTMTGANSAGSNWFSIFEAQIFSGGGSSTPSCSDGIQNQGETGIDCGGPCSACSGSVVQLGIASSATGGAFQTAPALSHDNNTGTRYTNDGTLPTASITYTLSSAASISRLRLMMYSGATRTYPIRIAVGSTVVFTGSTTLGSGFWEINFPAVTGTTVTVTMTGANSAGSNWFSIFEALIFGVP